MRTETAFYPDDTKYTSGQKPMDEPCLGTGNFQKLQIHMLSQTPHTQAKSDCIQLPLVIGYYVGARGPAFGSLTTKNPIDGMLKPNKETSASKYFETGIT